MNWFKKEKEVIEDITLIKHVKEQCGHEGDYDFFKIVPFHHQDWIEEKIEVKGKIIKRTFCPICMTYWEEEYKKLKVNKYYDRYK